MDTRILIADDDADNRAIMSMTLRNSGYKVSLARDGQEAIEVALKETPDFVLLDLGMPYMDGWTAVKKIKSMPQMGKTPIYAFTAYALAGDDVKAMEAGCDGFIAKPCIPKEVVEIINERLGK